MVYRFDPDRPSRRRAPRSPKEAQAKLTKGNRSFAHLLDSPGSSRVIPLDPSDVGHGVLPGVAPVQRPFAAVLGCSDARVPIETIFQQKSNDLFVVRVAGNGVGIGGLGSLRYAVDHFPGSLKLIVVLGHSQCGAVTSAVDVFLRPARYLTLAANYPLRSIVDSILVSVRSASLALETVFQQKSNDLFVVRVAGNGIGSGCLGSLRYAADHFPGSLKLVVVLGHSQCGAVTSAVDVFLRPARYLTLAANYPLRSIVDSILVSVRSASLALEAVHGGGVTLRPGYRAALIETSVAINACVAAYALKLELESRRCRVLFGTYDLASRYVRLPLTPEGRKTPSGIGLFPAPANDREVRRVAIAVAGGASIASLLRTGGGPHQH